MGFWLFCVVMDLLVPIVMLYFGRRFQTDPPKTINVLYGYRTTMSMRNQNTWHYAHQVCGRLWRRLGLILFPVSFLPFLFVYDAGADRIGILCAVICCAQVAVLLGSIIPVERALKKKFDRFGLER